MDVFHTRYNVGDHYALYYILDTLYSDNRVLIIASSNPVLAAIFKYLTPCYHYPNYLSLPHMACIVFSPHLITCNLYPYTVESGC